AFRPSEFGIRLQRAVDSAKSQSALVAEIERQTDRLSPLLLWPERTLGQLVDGQASGLAVAEFAALRLNLGISRYVLVNRLMRLSLTDVNRRRPGLTDLAVGIGEW